MENAFHPVRYVHQGFLHSLTYRSPNNNTNIDGLFVTDHASHAWQEGYVFILDDHDYYTFSPSGDGEVMFPIHDACLEVIEHVVESRNEVLTPRMPHATLETLYDSLCKQYARNAKAPPRTNANLSGLEWDHDYYGAREFQGYYDWEAGHGDEVGSPPRVPYRY
jgi:hypothetical protein